MTRRAGACAAIVAAAAGIRAVALGVAIFVLAGVLAGCGGAAPVDDAVVPDNRVERARRAGLEAFARGRYEQAAMWFRRALDHAYEQDDSRAAVDARYNLAASLSELESHEEALTQLRAAVEALRREERAVTTDVVLLQAVVSYRAGRTDAAATLARQVRETPGVGPDLAYRAWFLEGLAAADGGDRDLLGRARAALAAPAAGDPRLQADALELGGRLAALDGDARGAMVSLEDVARSRSAAGDYRATARALAAAAAAADAGGLARDAAILYLRAGRSAAARGAAVPARRGLSRSRELARAADDAATQAEASAALDGLAVPADAGSRSTAPTL